MAAGVRRPRVGAVVLLRDDGAALFQHRDDKPGLNHAGLWVPPGGHCEPGEDIEACARREFLEETGYRCGPLTHLTSIADPVNGTVIDLTVFWARYDGVGELRCLEGQALEFLERDRAHAYPIPPYLVDVWDGALAAAGLAEGRRYDPARMAPSDDRTREPQYQPSIEIRDVEGLASLGLMTNQAWRDDPRHLLFHLARYKFVAKMLTGRDRVLEVGCADAFGTRLVQQEVRHVSAVDFDPVFVEDVRTRTSPHWPIDVRVHDILQAPVGDGPFEAAYALDVLEHIRPEDERRFVGNIAASIVDDGVVILGSPSLESQAYASSQSRAGHVNCKSAPDLRRLASAFFANVFVFSLNDEVVHTGFHPMAQYLLALCCGKRPQPLDGA